MGVVEYHPGMVVLRSVGALTHVEPLNAPRQYHGGRKWTAGQHVSSVPPGNPLQTYQQRELTLH